MLIHVFERFTEITIGEPSKDTKGEKWEDITLDFKAPTYMTDDTVGWLLKCDFRLPYRGFLHIPHPTDDEKALEFIYKTPTCKIPNYIAGVIRQKNYTEELKKEWEALPDECVLQLGDRVTLTCRKDIVDGLEHSIDGWLYLYRPAELQIRQTL